MRARSASRRMGVYTARIARTTMVSVSCTCSGIRKEHQHRRDREGRQQRSDQRVAVGPRHRAEDLTFDALHGEKRNEGRERDDG